jgi:hypothetical protein
MKIGILTFHWATNYGAILQAFALQTYLKNLGYEVSIINYRPKQYKKTLFKSFFIRRFWLFISKLKEYSKEQKLEKFRVKFLNETLIYDSLNELKSNPPNFDVYICGSDQIWNPSFTTMGEGKPTPAYFLDFGNDQVKRIAYAVSFGCEVYPEKATNIARKYVPKFDAVSVREDSGIEIASKLGFNNPTKLPDPTLLLVPDNYSFTSSDKTPNQKKAFVYILRNKYKENKDILSDLKRSFNIITVDKVFNPISVEEWVSGIKNASIVLTNSFHGMVFSLIFHVPFVVIPAKDKGAGMNDRFITLLSTLDLEHRIINNYDCDKLRILMEEKINWQKVDNQLKELQNETDNFFQQVLS